MKTQILLADQIASKALIDSLIAELIEAGLVDRDRLADRVEAQGHEHKPIAQQVLNALASGLRRPPASLPRLRLVTADVSDQFS